MLLRNMSSVLREGKMVPSHMCPATTVHELVGEIRRKVKGDYMANYMTFFPVGNGDMTLIQTKTNKYIMIDCNIRNAENDDTIMIAMNTCKIICRLMMVKLFGCIFLDALR